MIIFDEKKMSVIMGHFIGRWCGVVNVKLPEDRSQRSEVRGLRISNAFFVLNLER
jgi:hypothetical protein